MNIIGIKHTILSDNDSHYVLGAVLALLSSSNRFFFFFFFMCKRLYVQKAVIGDSHGAVTLPLGIGFPQYSTHIDIETQQLCRPLPAAAQADCA